jgi:hypothetical protein
VLITLYKEKKNNYQHLVFCVKEILMSQRKQSKCKVQKKPREKCRKICRKKKSNWDRYLNSSLKWELVFSWHNKHISSFFSHLIIKIFALFSQTSKTYSIERLSSIIMYIQILTLVEAIVLLKNKMKIYII